MLGSESSDAKSQWGLALVETRKLKRKYPDDEGIAELLLAAKARCSYLVILVQCRQCSDRVSGPHVYASFQTQSRATCDRRVFGREHLATSNITSVQHTRITGNLGT